MTGVGPDSPPGQPGEDLRPFSELSDSGLLWLINATVFHPRGYALTLTVKDGQALGWKLQGDGTEPWRFTRPMDGKFAAAEATLAGQRAQRDGSTP